MPSDAFIGMLQGLGAAHQERQKNMFDQEVSRREQMAKSLEQLAAQPDITPEGKAQLHQQAFGIRSTDISKKLPKELEQFATEVAPKFGQSWLGGQTTNSIPLQNMPIASALPAPGTQPSLGEVQGGQVPPLGAQPRQPLPMQTPPPSVLQAAMPVPPPNYKQSIFESPDTQIAREAKLAGAKAKATAEAQEPAKMREAQIRAQVARIKQESDLAAHGLRPKYDPEGNQLGIEAIPDAELPAIQKAAVQKVNEATSLNKAHEDLLRAQAAYNNSKLDPNSPFNKQILARIDNAKQAVAISQARLGLLEDSQLARFYGVDREGKPLPGAVVDPQTGVPVGTAFQRIYMPTAATLTKAQTAVPVISQANDLIDFAKDPSNADLFGKVAGRWTELMAGKIGTDDPRMAVLAPKIRSLASLLAPLHGFRSANAAADFAKTMPLMDSPEAFAAAVREYAGVAQRVAEGGKPTKAATTPTGKPSSFAEELRKAFHVPEPPPR